MKGCKQWNYNFFHWKVIEHFNFYNCDACLFPWRPRMPNFLSCALVIYTFQRYSSNVHSISYHSYAAILKLKNEPQSPHYPPPLSSAIFTFPSLDILICISRRVNSTLNQQKVVHLQCIKNRTPITFPPLYRWHFTTITYPEFDNRNIYQVLWETLFETDGATSSVRLAFSYVVEYFPRLIPMVDCLLQYKQT